MTNYLLDTNAVSHLARAQTNIMHRIMAVPMTSLYISSITEGELLYGLARRPEAVALHKSVQEILRRVTVLPWGHEAARRYGPLRATLERQGRSLTELDMLIAAHALSAGTVLVTNDQVFRQVSGLDIEDWTQVG